MKKNVIIAGGSRGIGLSGAKGFLGLGYNVIIASANENNLKQAIAKIEHKKAKLLHKKCNISDESEVKSLFDFCKSNFGEVDILINCAAIIQNQDFIDLNIEDWQKLMDINVKGSVLCCYQAFKQMKNKGGNIINISSLGGLQNFSKFSGFSSYVTSKFAITGLTESLAVEGRKFNIRVNAIAPGAVDTEMLKKAAPNLKTSTKPQDIAKNIIYLCDDDHCNHITGTILTINSNE